MSLVVIVFWYVAGVGAAAWMVRRGHSPVPWWVGAALTGAVVWAFALPVAWRVGRRVRWTAAGSLPDVVAGDLVLALVDDEGAVATTAAAVTGPDDVVVALRRVGFEAGSSVVDTGELDEADAAVGVAGRRCPTAVPRVGSGPLLAVVESACEPHQPALVVRTHLGGAWRTDLRRSIQLAVVSGAPVLHAAPTGTRPAPAPAPAVGSAA